MRLFRRTWPYILLAVLLIANFGIWAKRQTIADWWRLRNYQAPAEVASLVSDTSMTPLATHLFYINHPLLEDKDAFNAHCSGRGEQTAVLGCYHGDRQGIYIYAVTDARLQGVRQVTAAHEMLHQAYDRLTDSERERVDALLEAYYKGDRISEAVKLKLDSYKAQPDAVLVNEMHSIFGSEVRDLPPELESYYKQYFTDRLKVVGLSEAYQAEFTRRQELVKQYDEQLADLKKRINANKAELEAQLDFLRTKGSEVDRDVAANNRTAYEADVRAYNSAVASYNTLLNSTRRLIDQHNDIVNKRNDIAVQERELQQALDSRLDTPNTKQ